ncbi:MAG: MupA/Atu3671 family FMN-dependent luciferase-like monooxygenase [Rubripirellula sp.]
MTERPVKSERFVVVRNTTGRSSCWPLDRQVPNGWTATAIAGTKQQCMDAIQHAASSRSATKSNQLQMSLMFFGDTEVDRLGDKYRLVMESASFADKNGFEGIWIPERHFTKFGCLYPSPAVLLAAIARETSRLKLRAGSVVMPLNDPIRVAEEWAVVDNLSGGRAEIAFASGWHPDDFALMPDAYESRNQRMYEGIDDVTALWRGATVERRNGAGDKIQVRTYPTPVRAKLPMWLTAAGNPETFRRAGEMGLGVLTHLFNQDLPELEEKIQLYRAAYQEAGHAPEHARVAVTLHTFVAESLADVRHHAKDAYCDYLRNNLGLLKQLAFSQGQSMDVETLPRQELDEMLEWLFDKFVGGRSLLGTVESCSDTCRELVKAGVDEIACLMDFGPDVDAVLSNLRHLDQLRRQTHDIQVN